MQTIELDRESIRQLVTDAVSQPGFRQATFGGSLRGTAACPWIRVVIRPVEIRDQRAIQFSYFEEKKHVAKNFHGPAVGAPLEEVLAVGFASIHLSTTNEEIDVRTTRKGKVQVGRRKVEALATQPPLAHNRTKDVPLAEGRSDSLLEAMGILTHDGHVRSAKRAKFTQINEFLRQLAHVLDDAGLLSSGRELKLLDCGCGLSYLTLAAHHYLNDVLAIPARIVGVDVNAEVIRKSVERSERVGAERVTFACSRIDAVAAKPDIVLGLHACDTATDDVIALAIAAEARILLSVPCCHHELNDRLRAEGAAKVLRPILRHGILQQRMADLVTDGFRALALRILGYRTDVIEFISTEHTARNLMIRAVRGAPLGDASLVRDYLAMRRFWGVTPYIEGVLGEGFQRWLSIES
ncbi:MAG: SAM-dependent methyltransferase [Gemmataceae bacterium]|nr:SAM-dependent methyltransferase [Gemmataceae bacterium]